MSEPRNEIDDLGFDPIDTELGARLRASAPEPGDADAVLAGMRPRLVRARRRRQAGFVAAGAAALALVAGMAFAVVDSTPRGSVNVPPASRSTVTGPDATTASTPEPAPTDTLPAEDEDRTGSPSDASSGGSGSSGAPTGGGSGTTVTTLDDHGGGSGSDDSPDEPDEPDDSDDDSSDDDSGSGSGGSGSGGSGSGGSGSGGSGGSGSGGSGSGGSGSDD